RRVVERRPIRARRAGAWLRLRRWAARQPALATGLAVLLFSLVSGLLWTAAMLQDAQRLTTAMTALLHNLDPLVPPIAQAEETALLRQLAGGDRERSVPDTEQAHGLWHVLGAKLCVEGRLIEARQALARAIALRTQLLGPGDPQTLHSRYVDAACLEWTGDLAGAEATYAAVLAGQRASLGETHWATVRTMENLLHLSLDRHRADEALLARITALRRSATEVPGNELSWQQAKGRMLLVQGHIDAAIGQLRSTLAERQRRLGVENLATLTTMRSLARALALRVETRDEARDVFERALELRRRTQWQGEPGVLELRIGLAELALASGDAARCRRELDAVFANADENLQPFSPILLTARSCHADQLLADGHGEGARASFADVLRQSQARLGEPHPIVLRAHLGLARCALQRGDVETARAHYDRAAAAADAMPHEHWLRQCCRAAFGGFLAEHGDEQRARALLDEARASLTTTLGSSHPQTRACVAALAELDRR
ncbi:MAG: tetratricopeptide repeat protein, partial [Planctomycetes bacterium]|nr:tetratricopeptide repeat protein [Planctomycetota bacterium]